MKNTDLTPLEYFKKKNLAVGSQAESEELLKVCYGIICGLMEQVLIPDYLSVQMKEECQKAAKEITVLLAERDLTDLDM